MRKKEFDAFFRDYAKNVDNANRHGFWQLSDALILQIIKDNIPAGIGKDAVILDAGGGTGRWVCDLSRIYRSHFVVYDRSRDMLSKAEANIETAGITERVRLVEGDLKDMQTIESRSVDYIVSIYSPISFIYEKDKALGEMFRVLKKGGKIIIMGQGYHNAIASKINNYCADARELGLLNKKHMVKWGEGVPALNVFSREIIEGDLKRAGFTPIKTYGVPVFAQPGPEDFDPTNRKKSRISAALEDGKFFRQVFKLEMEHNSRPEVVDRGMNMFAVALKK